MRGVGARRGDEAHDVSDVDFLGGVERLHDGHRAAINPREHRAGVREGGDLAAEEERGVAGERAGELGREARGRRRVAVGLARALRAAPG